MPSSHSMLCAKNFRSLEHGIVQAAPFDSTQGDARLSSNVSPLAQPTPFLSQPVFAWPSGVYCLLRPDCNHAKLEHQSSGLSPLLSHALGNGGQANRQQ